MDGSGVLFSYMDEMAVGLTDGDLKVVKKVAFPVEDEEDDDDDDDIGTQGAMRDMGCTRVRNIVYFLLGSDPLRGF